MSESDDAQSLKRMVFLVQMDEFWSILAHFRDNSEFLGARAKENCQIFDPLSKLSNLTFSVASGCRVGYKNDVQSRLITPLQAAHVHHRTIEGWRRIAEIQQRRDRNFLSFHPRLARRSGPFRSPRASTGGWSCLPNRQGPVAGGDCPGTTTSNSAP